MTRIAISEECVETLKSTLKEIDPTGMMRLSPSMLAAMMIARYNDHFINWWKSNPDTNQALPPPPPLPSFSIPTPVTQVAPELPSGYSATNSNNPNSPPPFEL